MGFKSKDDFFWLEFYNILGQQLVNSLSSLMGNSGSKEIPPCDKPSSPPSSTPLTQARLISLKMHTLTQSIITHCHSQHYHLIQCELNKITYNIPPSAFPLCLQSPEQLYCCSTCFPDELMLCPECFKIDQHQGHAFKLIKTGEYNICGCGNEEVRSPAVTCLAHVLSSKTMESEEELLRFKRQIKFLFNLVLLIKNDTNTYKLAPQNLATLANSLLFYLASIADDNTTITKLIQQTLLAFPDCLDSNQPEYTSNTTIFEEMMAYTGRDEPLPWLSTIVKFMMRTDTPKDDLLRIYFKYLFTPHKDNIQILAVFQTSGLRASIFPKSFLKYFLNKNNCCQFLPPLSTADMNFVARKYSRITKQYFQISELPNCHNIFANILEQTKLAEFLNFESYYVNNKDNGKVKKIGLYYSLLLIKIVRKIAQGSDGMSILLKLLKQCFAIICLNTAPQTFNHVFQRLFAVLIFQIFYHSLPNKKQLSNVLGKIQYEVVKRLLINYIQFKTLFSEDYQQFIVESDIKKSSNTKNVAQMRIVALDEFYFKVLSNYLEPSEVQSLYREYVEQHLGELQSMNQLDVDSVRSYFNKIGEFMKVLTVALPSNMPEMILKANSNKQSKQIEIILRNLLWINENTNSTNFKQQSQKYIQNEEIIVNFIKKQAVIDNKRIKNKLQQLPFIISISPNSEYIEQDMELYQFQRMISNNQKAEKNQFYERFFSQKSLQIFIGLWQKCAEISNSFEFKAQQHEKDLILTLQILCSLLYINQSPILFKLIEVFSKKLTSPTVKLQAYFKSIFNREMQAEKGQKSQSQKKKKKMQEMREKQQLALKTFNVQKGNKIDLQCIFCKNSSQGEPYLLGHFRYNNFYSKRILEMDVPFMQFTTCGHTAHQKCLVEMHKGQFIIWYPCILCKSITNILLPLNSAQLNDEKRLQKILDFLKNFAANYSFFFQNRKQLVQFGLNQISGVYKLLFKTLIYSLTIYPIVNHSYFLRNQFPILKFIFDLLKFTHKRVKNLTFSANYELKAENELSDIFHYHRYQLQFLIINNLSNMPLQAKIDECRDKFSEEVTEMFDEIYENLNDEKKSFECELKDPQYRDKIKGTIYKPPTDLAALRDLKRHCESCNKVSQRFEICLLCEWSCGSQCADIRKLHSVQKHIGESVFINAYTGQYTYLHEELTGDFSSIYTDYLGHQAKSNKAISVGQFTLNENSWSKIVNDIVCNRLHKEVMRLKG